MLREKPVQELMTKDVLVFAPSDKVDDAMRALLRRDVDAAPVVEDGAVVGMLSTADLIVEEASLHLPTVIALLGAYIELPSSKKKFDRDLEKAFGATVGEHMSTEIEVVGPEDSVEFAATIMHDQGVDRLPVVDDDGQLIGIIARGDIVRAIVREFDSAKGTNG